MEADKLFDGPATQIYASIVMDVAKSSQEGPYAERFPSEAPGQISIAVRGLRPSDILEGSEEYLNKVDEQFEILVNSSNDPAKNKRITRAERVPNFNPFPYMIDSSFRAA